MQTALRVALSGALAALALAGVMACTQPAGPASVSSTAVAREAQDQNAQALAAYVELERAQIPTVMAKYPGLYSKATVDGKLKVSTGQNGLSKGTHAVMFYSYLYANPVDMPAAIHELDSLRPTLDTACRMRIFPAMRKAGITGPLGAQFSYDDGTSEFGAFWHHYCSE